MTFLVLRYGYALAVVEEGRVAVCLYYIRSSHPKRWPKGEGEKKRMGSRIDVGVEGRRKSGRNGGDLLSWRAPSNRHPFPFSDTQTTMEDHENQQNTETGDDEILAALEGMEKVINELNIPGREFSISLHQQHIALATQAGLDDQVEAARMMMVQSVTCGDGGFL